MKRTIRLSTAAMMAAVVGLAMAKFVMKGGKVFRNDLASR